MVSVIIPVYNRQHTLERLFASLRRVTYRPVEFIFVDNLSTDGSKALCEAFCSEVSASPAGAGGVCAVTLSCPTPGACAARNVGLAAARGEHCCFFDSDDEFSADFLTSMMECIGDADICLTRTRMVMENGRERVRQGWGNPTLYEHLLVQNVSTQGFVARTDYVRAVGGWADLSIWQDYELGFRLLSGQYRLAVRGGSLAARPPRLAWNPGVWHRIHQHPDSITGGGFGERCEQICQSFNVLLHETFALCDKRATLALGYRAAIVRGHIRAEGFAEEARRLPINMHLLSCKLLELYVACGGRGAWRLACWLLKLQRL